MTTRTLQSITGTILWLCFLGFQSNHACSQDITFSSVSVIVKEDGTGKVIVDTRPQDQIEPLKPLSQPITGSVFSERIKYNHAMDIISPRKKSDESV